MRSRLMGIVTVCIGTGPLGVLAAGALAGELAPRGAYCDGGNGLVLTAALQRLRRSIMGMGVHFVCAAAPERYSDRSCTEPRHEVAERSNPPRPELQRFYYWDSFEAPLSRTDLGIEQIYLGIFAHHPGGPNFSCWPAPVVSVFGLKDHRRRFQSVETSPDTPSATRSAASRCSP